MQTLTTNPNIGTDRKTFRRPNLLASFQPATGQPRCRKVRISFVPRREVCLTKRAMLAAIREAELADWMASGGDFLASMHQPID